jgi:hypothetical protein
MAQPHHFNTLSDTIDFQGPPTDSRMGDDRTSSPSCCTLPPHFEVVPPGQRCPVPVSRTQTSQSGPRSLLERRPIPESEWPKFHGFPIPAKEPSSKLNETDPLANKPVRVAERKEISKQPNKEMKDEQPRKAIGEAGTSQYPSTEASDQMGSRDGLLKKPYSYLTWGKDEKPNPQNLYSNLVWSKNEEQQEFKEAPGSSTDAGEKETIYLLDKYCGQPSHTAPPKPTEKSRIFEENKVTQKSKMPERLRRPGPTPLGPFERSKADLRASKFSLPMRPKSPSSASPNNEVNVSGEEFSVERSDLSGNQANIWQTSLSPSLYWGRVQEESNRRYHKSQFGHPPSQGVQKRICSSRKVREEKRALEDLANLLQSDPVDLGDRRSSTPSSPAEQAKKLERELREAEERGESWINESKGLFWGRAVVPESSGPQSYDHKAISGQPRNVSELLKSNDKSLAPEEWVARKVEQRAPTPRSWSSSADIQLCRQTKISKLLEGGLANVLAAPTILSLAPNPAGAQGFRSALQLLRELRRSPTPVYRFQGVPGGRRPWTTAEEEALMTGIDIVKGPYWSQILALFGRGGSNGEQLNDRTEVQLTDRTRYVRLSLLRNGAELPPYLQAIFRKATTRVLLEDLQERMNRAQKQMKLEATRTPAQEQILKAVDDLHAGSGSMIKSVQRQERVQPYVVNPRDYTISPGTADSAALMATRQEEIPFKYPVVGYETAYKNNTYVVQILKIDRQLLT